MRGIHKRDYPGKKIYWKIIFLANESMQMKYKMKMSANERRLPLCRLPISIHMHDVKQKMDVKSYFKKKQGLENTTFGESRSKPCDC